jgi:hypothetical protein
MWVSFRPSEKRRARNAASAIASSALIKPILNDTGKSGTGSGVGPGVGPGTGPGVVMVVGSDAVLLPGFESPPPDTTAMFVTVPPGTLASTVVVTVIPG